MDPIPLPAPYGGVQETIPVIAIQSPNCQRLLNYNTSQEGLTLRNGDSKGFKQSLTGGDAFVDRIVPYGNTKLFLISSRAAGGNIDIYNLDTGAVSYSSGAGGTDGNYQYLFFNKYLFIMGEATAYIPGFAYNGSTWGATGWTGTSLHPMGGDVFNNRAYLIQYNEAAYWYTGINAISGAVTKVDLNTIISELSTLAIIAPITIADNVSAVTLQCFVFFSGEVLFYSGTYPDSADWRLEGKANIGQVLYWNSGVRFQGDYLVFCDSGVISLRDLFLKGSEDAASLTVNSNIQKTWRDLIAAIRTATSAPSSGLLYIHAVWDSKNQRIIISFPYYLDTSGAAQYGSFYFILDTNRLAWTFHRSFQATNGKSVIDIAMYKNKPYILIGDANDPVSSAMVSIKEGATGFTDRNIADDGEVNFDYEVISAPVSDGRSFVQKCEGLDIILESDLYDQTSYYLIKDLGVQTSSAQKIPSQPTGIQKPFANVGIEGSYIQYKISGTTTTGKTVGMKFYGTNFWQTLGDSPR